MGAPVQRSVSDHLTAHLTGPAAVPRKNGELVFETPWESRAFGMAVALCGLGLYDWEEFRARLISEIAAWDRDHPPQAEYRYYERWLAALEKLLLDKGFCVKQEIDARAIEQESR